MSLATISDVSAGRVPSRRVARPPAAFAAARRHTRLVRLLRVVIPVGAVAAAAGLIIAPFFTSLHGVANVSVSSVGISNGKVRMETPRLSGYRQDNRPYEVTAETAFQDIRNPTQVELEQLRARLQMEREGWVTVSARTGLFDTQKEQLHLENDVTVRTETGYDARMRVADVDFKGGTVVSKEPVKVSLGTTTVDANALDVKDNGALITFQGRVQVFIKDAPAGALAGPAGALAGPEREGSTPRLDLLKEQPAQATTGEKQ